mgnify:CR=1 FL=1
MAQQRIFSIGLGASYAGQTLRRTLLDDDGAMVSLHKDLASGFSELGGGEYLLNYADLPDNHVGSLVIHVGALGSATTFASVQVLGVAAVNLNLPQGGVIAGGAIDTVNDKTGYALSALGLAALSASPPAGDPATFAERLMWLVQRQRNAVLTASQLVVQTDAGSVITQQPVSDDGVTQILGPPTTP